MKEYLLLITEKLEPTLNILNWGISIQCNTIYQWKWMTNICIKWMNPSKNRVRKAKCKREQIAQFHFYAILKENIDRKETNSLESDFVCGWVKETQEKDVKWDYNVYHGAMSI